MTKSSSTVGEGVLDVPQTETRQSFAASPILEWPARADTAARFTESLWEGQF